MLWKDTDTGKTAWGVHGRYMVTETIWMTVIQENVKAEKSNWTTWGTPFLMDRQKAANPQRK